MGLAQRRVDRGLWGAERKAGASQCGQGEVLGWVVKGATPGKWSTSKMGGFEFVLGAFLNIITPETLTAKWVGDVRESAGVVDPDPCHGTGIANIQ